MSAACSQAVQGAFYNAFYNWGHLVGRKPKTVILTSFIVAIALSYRTILFFAGNPLPATTEQDELWVPQTAEAVDDKARYDAIFTNTFRRNTVYFTTKPPGGNVLKTEILKEMRRFDEMVNNELNATAWGAGDSRMVLRDDDGRNAIHYDDVCADSGVSFGQNSSDPDDDGGAPSCILFGHPFEAFYKVGGIFDFDYTTEEMGTILTSGKGIDPMLFPKSSDRTLNIEAAFGGIEKNASGHIMSAKAVALTFLLGEKDEGTVERDMARAFEDQLNYLIGSEWTDPCLSEGSASGTCHNEGRVLVPDDNGSLKWESELIEIFPSTAGATSRELGKNIRGDLGALQAGFMIILVYAVYIFGRCQPVNSRILLALSGIASVGLSIAIAYGFSVAIGFPLNPVINVLPFVLIGIGVDDMFVLVAALEHEDPKASSVPERMARAMGKAGVSITITSLTDIFAFLLGTTSQLPALSTFCVYACVGIFADFTLQITFFAGWMALDAYREKNDKIDCCPCCCPDVAALRSEGKANSGCCCFTRCYDKHDSLKPLGLKAFLKRFYIPLLRIKGLKLAVLAVFVGWCGASLYCALQLKQDFQFRWFVNDDAKLQDTFDIQDAYFQSTGLPVSIVTPPSYGEDRVDYSTIKNQMRLVTLGENIEGNEYVEEDSLSSWYPLFREWIHSCDEEVDFGGTTCTRRDCAFGGALGWPHCTKAKNKVDESGAELEDENGRPIPSGDDEKYMVDSEGKRLTKATAIEESFIPEKKFYTWLDQFLMDAPLGGTLTSEIVYETDKTDRDCSTGECERINATRIRANYKSTDAADEQVDSMRSLREAVREAELGSSFPYMFMYLYYEQYAIIESEAILNLGLALVAVFLITLVIIANLRATLMVMLCVIMVDIDILGLMWLWGLTIDSVAIINLVLAIGLAVDYSAHVAHAFCQTPGTNQERVEKAVEEMGTAVIHGAFSTFLAVLILSVSQSYIFRIFFKQFFGICIFGASHGLVFLPIILSFCGPAYVQVGKTTDTKDSEMTYSGSSNVPSVPASPPTVGVVSSPPPSAPSSECGSPHIRTSASSAKIAPYIV